MGGGEGVKGVGFGILGKSNRRKLKRVNRKTKKEQVKAKTNNDPLACVGGQSSRMSLMERESERARDRKTKRDRETETDKQT